MMEARSAFLVMAIVLAGVAIRPGEAKNRHVLGSHKCTYGPSYWCSGLRQSMTCSMTKRCIDSVWMQRPAPPEDDDEVCTICKNMVQEARDTLESNETQEELRQVFEGSCALIPISAVAEECKKLADEFIPELIETLASEMNPTLVCTTAGLCNSGRVDALLAEHYAQHPRTECDVCKDESRKLVAKIRAVGQKMIVDKLLVLCGELSSYSDACRATVVHNADLIYNTLLNVDNELCDLVGICSETYKNELSTYTGETKEDVQCEFCEKVIQHWVDTWTANTTESEFKQVLEAMCHHLHDNDRIQRCLHIVDEWYLPLFNYLLHEIKPHLICQAVGLCGNQGFMKVSNSVPITLLLPRLPGRSLPTVPMTPIQPARRIIGQDEANAANAAAATSAPVHALIGGYFVPETVAELSRPGCVICEYVLRTLVDQQLEGGETEDEIEAKLNDVCKSAMPAPLKSQCGHLVSTYQPALVKLLHRGMTPSEICLRLQACTGDLLGQQSDHQSAELQMIHRQKDSCALCEYAVNTVYEFVNDTSDQRMIKNVLDTVCYHLPKSVRNECVKMVNEYTGPILNMIVNNLTPDQICRGIQMCQESPSPSPAPTPKPAPFGSEECVLCEYAVTTLDKLIGDKHNEEEVRKALDNLCSHLPNSIKNECTQFVDTYSDMVIDLIAHDLTPDQVCQALGLCKQGEAESEEPEETEEARPYCTLCEYAIGEVDKLITDKKDEQEIKEVLDKICYHLSKPIVKECLNMVNQYTDEIIAMFVHEYTPAQVCAELHLCKAKTDLAWEAEATNDIGVVISNDIPPMVEDVEQPAPSVSRRGASCVICEYVMSYVDKRVLTNQTVDMAERAVQMICSYLPNSVAEPCEQFVDEYGDKIVKMLVEQELDPELVCTELQLCQAAAEEAPAHGVLVGGSPCTFGPSYWCLTPVHAKICGATKHCEENGWAENY